MFLMNLDLCKKINIRGLLCTEAAAGYWGLSSYDYYTFPVFMVEGIHGEVENFVGNVSFLAVPEPITFEDTTDLGDGVFVTNKIRTVCDMIKYDSDEFHKLETIYNFYCYESEEDIAELEKRIEAMGLTDTLVRLREEAEEIVPGE